MMMMMMSRIRLARDLRLNRCALVDDASRLPVDQLDVRLVVEWHRAIEVVDR